jgi:hypothetical protein
MNPQQNAPTWPDLAIGLYDKLTGRGAEISYQFEELSVGVPRDGSDSNSRARWTLDGTVKISTQDRAQS